MEQIEVARDDCTRREVLHVGQACGRVFGSEACDVVRGFHGLLKGSGREVGRARVAAALAHVDRDAHRLVAVAFDVLGLALAHRDRQADAFRDLGHRIARTELSGVTQR